MERSCDLYRFLARYLEPPAPPEPAMEASRARAAESHRARGMEPFGCRPQSTRRSYDSGPADQRRALRDSEELSKEQGVIRIPEIPYDESPGAEPSSQSVDVFTRQGLATAPAVLYVQGGLWVRGDKRRALFKAAALVPEGYLFASMTYRFRPRVTLSDMARDVAAAAAWPRTQAAKYGGDGLSVFLMGHSAGAHLVSGVGTYGRFLSDAGGALANLAGVAAIDTAMYNMPLQMNQPGPALPGRPATIRAPGLPSRPGITWRRIRASRRSWCPSRTGGRRWTPRSCPCGGSWKGPASAHSSTKGRAVHTLPSTPT